MQKNINLSHNIKKVCKITKTKKPIKDNIISDYKEIS